MLNQLSDTLDNYNLIKKDSTIVVGVSGGPDSIALLYGLYLLKDKYNITLIVVHLDHEFRGAASKEDAEYVRQFCNRLNVEAYIFNENIEKMAQDLNLSFEEAGRKKRYELFRKVKNECQASYIAVAQNKNDQAETLLMRLFRGAGLEGLTAIKYHRDDIIRPLLNISRDDIEMFCQKHNLKPRIDLTNAETIYTRNKIRHELVPYIKENFNNNILESLFKTSQLLNNDLKYIQKQVDQVYYSFVRVDNDRYTITIDDLLGLDLSISSRLIRKIILQIRGNLKNISFDQIHEILEICKNRKSGVKKEIPPNILFEVNYEHLIIYIEKRYKKNIKKILKIGENQLEEFDCMLEYDIINKYENNNCNDCICVDYNKIEGDLFIRNRKPGDSFQPLGMNGRTKKLKKFFSDEKIDRVLRDRIPILCDSNNIIWILGYRMSEKYKITKDTTKIARFKIKR